MILKQVVTLVAIDEDSGREISRIVTKAQNVIKNPDRITLTGRLTTRALKALKASMEGL